MTHIRVKANVLNNSEKRSRKDYALDYIDRSSQSIKP